MDHTLPHYPFSILTSQEGSVQRLLLPKFASTPHFSKEGHGISIPAKDGLQEYASGEADSFKIRDGGWILGWVKAG